MSGTRSVLARMLAPRSVAVIGASTNPEKAGGALMRSLAAFPGTVHPVNPRATEVAGRRAHARVDAIPGVLDLALLAVPAAAVPDAVADCAAAGMAGVVVHAGGFAELGDGGAALQGALAATARAGGMRLLGPNTSGFIAPPQGLCATFVASTAELRPGPLAIVAQSGGVNHALAFGAHAEGLGIRLGVGLGNAADLGFPELIDHVAADPGVRVVVLAIEGVRDGRALIEAVERAVDRVPVVALKLGRTDVNDFARSHTGVLAVDYAVTRAALRQAGAVVVDDTTALIDAARALSARRLAPTRAPSVGVLTGQAGPGLLLADVLAAQGAVVPRLPAPVQERLADLVGGLTYVGNPVDTGRPSSTLPRIVRTLADEIDALAVYMLHEPEAADPRPALAEARVPTVLATAGPPGEVAQLRDELLELGISVMPTPERAAAAVCALLRDAEAAARRLLADEPRRAVAENLDVRGPWDEAQAKRLVSGLGIPVPRGAACATHDDALSAASAIGFPIVLKLVHPTLAHKTEKNAIRVGISNARELEGELASLDEVDLPSPGSYLVEELAPPGPELLLGAIRDPAFGPVVVLGAGGVETELRPDTTMRLAPLARAEAATMLDDLATAERYRGHRGGPSVDEQELARVIVALADVVCSRPDLSELEINPLRVTPGGLLALDALVVGATTATSRAT